MCSNISKVDDLVSFRLLVSSDKVAVLLWTYGGLGDPSHGHRKAQQAVVLVVRQTQQFGNVLESLGRSQPVQTGQGLAERHGTRKPKRVSVALFTHR